MTGNRRFWPVRVKKFSLVKLRAIRDQLWAEAAYRESHGASIRLAQSLWPVAGEHQEARVAEDPWMAVLAGAGLGVDALDGKVEAADLYQVVQMPVERQTIREAMRLSEIMQKLGWHRPNTGGRLRRGRTRGLVPCYVRGDEPWTWLTLDERSGRFE